MLPTPPTHPTRLTQSLLIALATVSVLAKLPVVHAADSAWNVDAAGPFSNPANWSAGVPGATTGTTSTDVATFGRSILGASRIVTFDEARNLGGITFDNTSAVAGRVFTVSAATLGGATPVLTLSPNAVIQNTGTGTAVTGANTLDVGMLLTGNTTFSNTYGNSVINIGVTTGNSANAINTAADLGAIDLTLTGTSTAGNLLSLRLNQATGTTLRVVKEGTGFWQINGPTATPGTMSGGLLIRQGGVSLGRSSNLPFGSGPITFGDSSTVAGDIYLQTGSGVTINNNITVASSAATNAIIERTATGGDSIYQGTITLERDLVLRQRTTGTARNLNIASNSVVTGTGNVIIDTTLASATGVVTLGGGSGVGTGSINMTGKIINQSSTGAAGLNITGKVLENVTEVVQNSATSTMTISNAANLFGKTTIDAGTISVTSTGRLGTGDVTVNAGTLTLASASALQSTSNLLFSSVGTTINLNFSGAATVNTLGSIGGSFITPGTYSVAGLNTFFGGSNFAGIGSLEVTAIPEPSSFAALAGLVVLGLVSSRRRSRA